MCTKESLWLLLFIISIEGWDSNLIDIKTVFLQDKEDVMFIWHQLLWKSE